MKIVVSWLREFCPTDLDADEIAELLTGVGVKVEEVIRPWAGLEGVVVAKVLEVSDHPNSDKLCVTRVDAGSGEATVAAGVRNMVAGDLVPYAPPGSRVPVLTDPLAVKTLRGVDSAGMLCSPRELAVADHHEGILILPPDTPIGADVAVTFGLSDAVLDIEIEPNRPDLMSVIGVARELAAVTGVPLQIPDPVIQESDEDASAAASIEIRALDGCPEYRARVIRGVALGSSPLAAQARLTASGMRPISNVVDATNYALLEIGHPLHPFDLALVEGARIVVRRADEDETLETLDGVERTLTPEDLLIADAAKGVAVAGIMGSASAEVSDATKDVLLESAYFTPTGVLRTARRLGLSTEASQRFERGADPEAPRRAADRASELITAWSGGSILRGVIGEGDPPARTHIAVRPTRAAAVLGEADLTADEVARRLEVAGFAVTSDADAIDAEVPSYRIDVDREIDLIEELARVEGGYARVTSSLPAVRQAGGLPDGYAFARRIRELLVRSGFHETWSLSFASEADLELMHDPPGRAIRIANPLAADEAYLRTRLTPGLLRTLQHNRARLSSSTSIFEVGTVFRAGDPVDESVKIGFALSGSADDHWSGTTRSMDFFDAKGAMEALLSGLGIEDWSLGDPAQPPLHPGRSADVLVGGTHAGVVGELHPAAGAAFDLTDRVAICVLGVGVLRSAVDAHGGSLSYRDVPRFPPLRRDLAFVVPGDALSANLASAMTEAGGELLGSVTLFDVYDGDSVGEGRKSLAFSVEFRAPDRTLTDEEAEEVVTAIAARLAADFGAELRAG